MPRGDPPPCVDSGVGPKEGKGSAPDARAAPGHHTRDFSNGYLVAEVLSRYFPGELSLHSFDNAASNAARKRDNWALLEKFTKVSEGQGEAHWDAGCGGRQLRRLLCGGARREGELVGSCVCEETVSHLLSRVHAPVAFLSQKKGFVLTKAEVDALVGCEPDAAPPLVGRLYDWLGSSSARDAGRKAQGDADDFPLGRDPATLHGRGGSPERQLHHATQVRGGAGTQSGLRGALGGTQDGQDMGPGPEWGTSTAVRDMQDVSRSVWLGDSTAAAAAAAAGGSRGRGGYDEAAAYRAAVWRQQHGEPDGEEDFAYTASDGEHPLGPDQVWAARQSRSARRSAYGQHGVGEAPQGYGYDGYEEDEYGDGGGPHDDEIADDEGGPSVPQPGGHDPNSNSLEARFSALQADYRALSTTLDGGQPAAGGGPGGRRRVLLPQAQLGASDADASLVSWGLPAPATGGHVGDTLTYESQTGEGGGHVEGWSDDDDDWGADDQGGSAGRQVPRSAAAGGTGGRLGVRVDFVPYTLADYKEHVATGNAYWQLGSLGPDLDREDVVEKRAARQRALEFARQANSQNQVELASRRGGARPRQGPQTARERMRAWAQGTFAPGGGLISQAPQEVLHRARSISPSRPGTEVPAFRPGSTLSPTPLGMSRRKGVSAGV